METFDKAIKESKKQDAIEEQTFETDFDKEKAKNINCLIKKKPKKEEQENINGNCNKSVNGLNTITKGSKTNGDLLFEKRTREEAENSTIENNKENTNLIDSLDKVTKH